MRRLVSKLLDLLFSRLPADSPLCADVVENALDRLADVNYRRLRNLGFRPGGIIDIGAHVGDWTRSIKKVFPSTPVLMVEARESQRPYLEAACAELGGVSYVIALLGSKRSEAIEFHVHDTGSSLFSERSNVSRTSTRLPMNMLDELAGGFPLSSGPLFIKLDVQGAEIEVLRGAIKTLARAEIVQLEVQLLHYNEGAPSAASVIAFMDQNGFAIFDIAGFVRPNKVDLVQIDLLFVRKNSRLRPDYFNYSKKARESIEAVQDFASAGAAGEQR